MDPDPFLIIYLSILKSDLFWIQTLLVIILLFFSAVISGAEVAFFSLQVKSLEDDDKEEISISKKRVISLLKKPKRLLATILVANNFINIAIVILFTLLSKTLFQKIYNPLIILFIE